MNPATDLREGPSFPPALAALALVALAAVPARCQQAPGMGYSIMPNPSAEEELARLKVRFMETERAKQRLEGMVDARLDRILQQAKLIKRILSGLFRDKPDFAYTIRRAPVQIDVFPDSAYPDVRRRLWFLGEPQNGKISLTPGNEASVIMTQLAAELSATLREAARLARCADPRIQVLADWGLNTHVHWPRQDGTDETTTVRVLEWPDYRALAGALEGIGACR